MSGELFRRLGLGVGILSLLGVFYVTPASAQELGVSPQRALLDRYCVTCHNERLRTAELTLDTVDVANLEEHAETWEKVARKLRAGAMPPTPRPRPDEETYNAFANWIESGLDSIAAREPNPGRTEAFHRLNRTEYHNVIRDLLALDVDVAELLPADDGSYGFDNIAGVLGMSPTLLERYLSAAKKVSRLAVGNPALLPEARTFHLAADYTQDHRIDGLPFGTRGGISIPYNFPLDAEYVVRLRLGRDTSDALATFDVTHELDVSLDGEHLKTFRVGEPTPARARPCWSTCLECYVQEKDFGVSGDAAATLPTSVHKYDRRRYAIRAVSGECGYYGPL